MTVLVLSSSAVSITWIPPASEHQNGLIRSYEVILRSDPDNKTVTVTGDRLATNITGLRAYTTYMCSVLAVTVRAGPTTRAAFTTLEDGR